MAAEKYASDDIAADPDRPAKVCAEAGRKCVRSLRQYPILSREWFGVVDSLGQLARLVQLEGRMPANSKVAESAGRNLDSDGTLWDQEAHENAIRILVEEAKVNLCLRMINEFKRWHYDPALRTADVQQAMREFELSEGAVMQKCKAFEESLGLLLWRSFIHVETLQLMDIPLLIEHCAMVLNYCENTQKSNIEGGAKEQEFTVMYYVSALFNHAEALNNSELLAKCREFKILPLSVSHILAHVKEYPGDITFDVACGLAALCDNEDFQTEWQDFLDAAERADFLQLQQVLVEPLLVENPDRTKDLRPLTDFFNVVRRKLR